MRSIPADKADAVVPNSCSIDSRRVADSATELLLVVVVAAGVKADAVVAAREASKAIEEAIFIFHRELLLLAFVLGTLAPCTSRSCASLCIIFINHHLLRACGGWLTQKTCPWWTTVGHKDLSMIMSHLSPFVCACFFTVPLLQGCHPHEMKSKYKITTKHVSQDRSDVASNRSCQNRRLVSLQLV